MVLNCLPSWYPDTGMQREVVTYGLCNFKCKLHVWYIPKVLEQKTRLDAEIFLHLDASGRLIFYAQTHARRLTWTHAKIFSCILCLSCYV